MHQHILLSRWYSKIAFLLLLSSSTNVAALPTESQWLSATDGDWLAATNWSTAPVFPNNDLGDLYSVRIDAAGVPYIVTLADDVAVVRITIDSPDATLKQTTGRLSVEEIQLLEGTLELAGELVGAKVTGPGQLQVAPGSQIAPVFDHVTLGVDLVVPPSGTSPQRPKLVLRNGLEILENATLFVQQRNAMVQIDGTQTLSGAGELVFDDSSGVVRSGTLRISENSTLTVGPEFAIRATTMGGSIGEIAGASVSNPNMHLVNQGTLSGEADRRPLHIMDVDPASGATFQNQNIVQAIGSGQVIIGGNWTNQGTLRIRDSAKLFLGGQFAPEDMGTIDRQGGELIISGTVQNTGKTLLASAATGDILLGGGPARVVGGTLDSEGGVKWLLGHSELTDVHLASDATIDRSTRVDVLGNLTFDDAILSLTDTFGSEIHFRDVTSPQTLGGTGTIKIVNGRVHTITAGQQLTITSGVSLDVEAGTGELRGRKLITESPIVVRPASLLKLTADDYTNRGTIESAGFLTIGGDGQSTWKNEGTIRVKPNSSLTLAGTFEASDMGTLIDEGAEQVRLTGVLDNRGRTLDLEDLNLTVPLTLDGGEIRGGVITSSGSSALDFVLGSTHGGVFNGVTLATNVTIPGAGGQVRVENGLTLDNIFLTMPEGSSLLFRSEPQFLGGTGVISTFDLSNVLGSTRISGTELTLGENITIRNGLRRSSSLELVFRENRGTIIAEAPDTAVQIGTSVDLAEGSSWTNNGTILVLGGLLELDGNYSVDDIGNLDFQRGRVTLSGNILNENKTIAQNASTGLWEFRGNIFGGRLETADGMVADLQGSAKGLTLAGEAVVFDDFSSSGDGSLRIRDFLELDGGILTIQPDAELQIAEQVLIHGEGVILLNGAPQSSSIQTFTGAELTVGENVLIKTGPAGGGSISRGDLPVLNRGTISAESPRQTLLIDGSLQNTGTLQALRRSVLRIDVENWMNEGDISLAQGTIIINGSSFENGVLGLLRGNGRIDLPNTELVNRGTISPGPALGQLTVAGSLSLQSTSDLQIDIGGSRSGEFDSISVFLNTILGGELSVNLVDGFLLKPNQEFLILDVAGERSGEFADLPNGALVGNFGGTNLFINYTAGNGNDIALYTAVPEPTSSLLLLIACVVNGVRRYRATATIEPQR